MNKYQYWLANIEGIGSRKAAYIIEAGLTAKELYMFSRERMKEIEGLKNKDVISIDESRYQWKLDEEYEKVRNHHIRFTTIEDDYYPNRIREITPYPYILYYKGKLPPQDQRTIAIVGSRMCTPYGKYMARELGKVCAMNKIHVISGLARGVDTLAQISALEHNGYTYGIFGSGVNVCYPPENINLMKDIIEHGGIISEYAPDMRPKPSFFSYRNRLISGFADAVIVVEAKKKSGTLITVDYALEQGKDVYAVPGRTTDPVSEGTNQLIRQGATPIASIQSFMEDFSLFTTNKEANIRKNKLVLEEEQSLVYSYIRLEPKSLDEILENCKLPLQQTIGVLSELIEMELVQEYYKNYFSRSE